MKKILAFLVLAALWLLLSQHWTPLLLTFGVLSCVLVVVLMHRLEAPRTRKGRALRLRPLHLLRYWAWLAVEIVKANIAVTRTILSPSISINPVVMQIPASGMEDMEQVIYANSITLTPGTIAMDLHDEKITVHALFRDSARELLAGEMMRRVAMVQGVHRRQRKRKNNKPTIVRRGGERQ